MQRWREWQDRVSPIRNGAGRGHVWRVALRPMLLAMLVISVPLAGCSVPRRAPEIVTPAWVLSPPPDTTEAIHGVGEGADLAAAKRNALRDIAGKLRVTVSGAIKSQVSVRNGQVDRSASSSVLEEVQKTEFRNPALLQSAPSAGGVFALVRVDRADLLADTRERIGRLALQVQSTLGELDRRLPIEQFIALKRVMPLLASQQGLYQLFGARDMTAADSARKGGIDALLARAQAAGDTVILQVRSRRDDADIGAVVSGFLTDQGLRTSDLPLQVNAQVDVSVQQSAETIQQDKLVRLSIGVVLRDPAGRALAARDYVASGASLIDHAAARQQALRKFQADLRVSGLLGGLGISVAGSDSGTAAATPIGR